MAETEFIVDEKLRYTILFIGVENKKITCFTDQTSKYFIDTIQEFDELSIAVPDLIVFDAINKECINAVRKIDKLVLVPIIIISDTFTDLDSIESISNFPRLLICNTTVAVSKAFERRIESLINRKNCILSARTGLIIKYTIFVINNNNGKQLTRTKLAEKAGIAEDYLSRIFHQEMGVTLWEYINTYRMFAAMTLLLQTDDTIYEVASKVGFPDAAYFNRVFHNSYGISPGQFRKTGLPSKQ